MITIDLIIDHIGQLCVIPAHDGKPQRGSALGDLGIIENAAVAIRNDRIVGVGEREEVLSIYKGTEIIDAQDRLVTPGLIDPHTHVVWMGDRAEEFEMRIQGATYQEIMAAGGGILNTVQATREAVLPDLVENAKPRLMQMLAHGTTTAEVKTGYGLSLETELAMLNAIALLDLECKIDLVPTFMGAHAIPPEYVDNPDAYVQLVIEEMIPAVAAWKAEHWPDDLYCDVFCDQGAFTLNQTRHVLEAAKKARMGLRLHVDEFASQGGIPLAVEMGAVSADHLLVTQPVDIAVLGASNTIAVLLPATPFGLNIPNTAPAQALLRADAILAIGTDCNPGTAWCESMQMSLALATRTLKLTPAQALAAATINAAFVVGRDERIGSVEVGKQADLVIWDTNDYRHLGYRFGTNLVHSVIKNGEIVIPVNPPPSQP